jgi:hypothetical protein
MAQLALDAESILARKSDALQRVPRVGPDIDATSAAISVDTSGALAASIGMGLHDWSLPGGWGATVGSFQAQVIMISMSMILAIALAAVLLWRESPLQGVES